MKLVAFDALILYLYLNADIDLDFSTSIVFIILRRLQNCANKSFVAKIFKVIIMKMCVNFLLNEHVVANQRTVVFLMCMQKRQ